MSQKENKRNLRGIPLILKTKAVLVIKILRILIIMHHIRARYMFIASIKL